ncbi:hypothetical protein OAI07_01375 [Akkermansiaceae bacterium]|nr:hypothetical protein [Akkermansiaceae bacterium]
MITVPLNNSVGGGSIGGKVSAGLGANVVEAQAGLTSAIGKVGQQAFDTAVKLERIKNEKMLSEHKASFKRMTSEYQNGLAENHDPETWHAGYKERFGAQMAEVDTGKLSPEAQEAFQDWAGDYQSTQELNIQRDATLQGIKNGKMTLDSNQREYETRGDYDSSAEEIRNSSLLSDEEKRQSLIKLHEREKTHHKKQQMESFEVQRAQDPFALAESLEKNAYGLSPYENEKQKEKTKRAILSFQDNQYGSMIEGVHMGDIDSVEDVERMGSKLTEYQRFKLGEEIERRDDHEFQKKLKSPQEQQRLLGEISNSIDDYEPTGDIEDLAYADIASQINGLQNSAYKKEKLNTLNAKRKGAEPEIKNVADWSRKQVSEYYKEGGYGKLPDIKKKKLALGNYINDGIFEGSTLNSLGLTDKEKKEINAGETNKEKLHLFKEAYQKALQDKDREVTANEWELKFANAAVIGKGEGYILDSYDDADSASEYNSAKERIERQKGAVIGEMEEYLKLNPKATISEANEQLIKIGVDVRAGDTDKYYKFKKPTRKTGGSDRGQYGFEKEARLDSSGNVMLYSAPKSDKNSMEVAGFGNVTNPDKYNQLKSLLDKGDKRGATNLAKKFMAERGSSFTKNVESDQAAGILNGVIHHRGEGGFRKIASIMGIKGGDIAAKIEEASNESGFAEKWIAARSKQERENELSVWRSKKNRGSLSAFREQRAKDFGRGLMNRWKQEARDLTA